MLAKTNNVDVLSLTMKRYFAVFVLLPACQLLFASALTVRTEAAPILRARALRAHPGHAAALSLLHLKQTPGPTPNYVSYGEPEFTTFSNLTTACQACMEFFPEKEDGKRFHLNLYEDKESGGIWERSCRAGKCDFRDPQTDPVGGIVGKGDNRICITRDPVQWYSDCDPILRESTQTLLDATRYCSYHEQIFIPPPKGTVSRFAGKVEAWERIGLGEHGKPEQCLATIEKEGAALLDGQNFCDSDLPALSGCCESIFNALNCVAETSKQTTQGIFTQMGDQAAQMFEAFNQFCVPLCQYTKEEFCSKEEYKGSDVCIAPEDCSQCTSRGGLWCPKLKSCHCPSKSPPCIAPPVTSPLMCPFGLTTAAPTNRAPGHLVEADADTAASSSDDDSPLCKYEEFALKWRPRD